MPVLNLFCTHHFFIFKSDVISVFLIFAWTFGLRNTSKMFMALGFDFLLHGFILHAALFTRKSIDCTD